jgi:ketosteroid isomerase-like protein
MRSCATSESSRRRSSTTASKIEELRDAGGDKVMAVLREQARGRASGLNVERRSGWVITFRGGKVLGFEIFLDPADALEAVGLRQ